MMHTKLEHPPSDRETVRPSSTILVPLDGSARATDVLPVAHGLARLLAATIHIVHVSPQAVPLHEVCDKLRLATGYLPGTVLDQRTGAPASAIIDEAKKWESRFIVMCRHTAAEEPEGGFGEIAREILLQTPCPVVLVPSGNGPGPWSIRRMLVPHDGTPTSAHAIGLAGDLCHLAGAEMTILHVATAAAFPSEESGALSTPRYVDQPQHEWPVWGTEFLSRARAIGRPPCEMKLRTVLCTENVGAAIARFAADNESDLIVLAWRMHFEQTRALTLRMVVQQASCPVMIHPIHAKGQRSADA